MFQERVSVIRDPGRDSLVRIVPELCGRGRGVTDESILIVPPGTKAYIAVNGTLLENPILPGRYSLYGTGESNPFFRRLKHYLKNGDPGTSFSVFYLSDEKKELVDLKTGEILIRTKKPAELTMKVYGSINLALTIGDPLLFLKKIVGTWNSHGFSTAEDLESCFNLLVLPPVREILATELAKLDILEFNQNLSRLSKEAEPAIAARLAKIGLLLEPDDFMISGFQFSPAEIQRLYALESQRASGIIATDLELDQLHRIYGGDLRSRTLAYAAGAPARGQANGNNGMITPMMQVAMLARSGMFDGLTDMYTGMFHPDDKERKE